MQALQGWTVPLITLPLTQSNLTLFQSFFLEQQAYLLTQEGIL